TLLLLGLDLLLRDFLPRARRDLHFCGDACELQLQRRQNQELARREYAGRGLRNETSRSNSDLEISGRDVGKEILSILPGLDLANSGLSRPRQRDPSAHHNRATLIDHRAADGAGRLLVGQLPIVIRGRVRYLKSWQARGLGEKRRCDYSQNEKCCGGRAKNRTTDTPASRFHAPRSPATIIASGTASTFATSISFSRVWLTNSRQTCASHR